MALHDIALTATAVNWRLYMVRKADKAFLAFQEKIFKRDDYTCQFCGFRACQYQEVVNLDGNYRNNRANNLATACPFCAQCFFLEAIGKSDFGGGSLIYLPEMTQSELNALCHVLFASIVSGNSYSTEARNIYRSLRLRTQQIEEKLGQGFSNPSHYGQLLIDASEDKAHDLHLAIQEKVRVLPDLVKFAAQIETWAVMGLKEMRFTGK